MSLQGQAAKSYTNLMNRSRPVKKEDKPLDSQGFLMEQFTQLQKLRAGLKNG